MLCMWGAVVRCHAGVMYTLCMRVMYAVCMQVMECAVHAGDVCACALHVCNRESDPTYFIIT